MVRPRIVGLSGSLPVVVLHGAAGSGTSTAAAQIAESGELPLVWCRLAEGYSGAADLVEMVADVLGVEIEPQHRVVDLAGQLLDLLEADPHSIVIDDHHLSIADLDRLIAELSGLLEPGLRIIVARESRPAGLIGLLSPADVAILDAEDLAFTDSEAVELFSARGASADDAIRWNTAVGGWPVAIAAGAMDPEAPAAQQLAPLIARAIETRPDLESVLDLACAVPYVNSALLAALNIGVSVSDLESMARSVAFVRQDGSYFRLSADAAALHRNAMSPSRLAELRREVGRILADSDPVTAIEVLLEAGEPDAAADVLADHLSEIGVERALNWLYRLPDEIRRRFPPVLAAGRATVEVDSALAVAQARLEAAQDPTARREALYALGSVESFRGQLASAAGAFEAAMRCGSSDVDFVGRVAGELASTRWLLGDTVGAEASLRNADNTPATRWLAAQLSAFVDDLPTKVHSEEPPSALDLSSESLLAALGGDDARASELSSRAYAAAVDSGGDDLVAAGPIHAWMILRSGGTSEALVIAEEVERRLGPRHQLARVHGALIRERCSSLTGDSELNERDLRRLRDLRATGYASIENLFEVVLGKGDNAEADQDSLSGSPSGLLVTILGVHTVQVDDRIVNRSDWKSKKALEVLTTLGLHGSAGARREQIIEAVWPGRPPEKGRTLLRTALSDIRRVLEPNRPAGERSRFVSSEEDRIVLDGTVDIDQAENATGTDPVGTFDLVVRGLAPEVEGAAWAEGLEQRVDRLVLTSAALIPESAAPDVRIDALESQIALEPWQRSHYDSLASLHRRVGNELAADDVERRWFADD